MNEKYQTTVATFDANADQYLAHFKNYPPYEPTYDAFLHALQKDQSRVLELGCGPGNVSHYLLKQRSDLTIDGIDFAPRMIDLAQQLNPQADYKVMDCRNIKQLTQKYHAIMGGFCLPYLNPSDRDSLVRDAVNLLTKGGVLYLSWTPGKGEEKAGYQHSKSSAGAVYVYHHKISHLTHLLKQLGLHIFYHQTIEHIHNQQSTHDVFVMARKPIN